MKLKHFLLISALCASVTVFADDTYPSNEVKEFPLNDSIVNWQDEGMVIMEDGKAFVTMYHNQNGIFFQVLLKDRRLQQQALRQGLVVNVDPNGKKKTKYAVHFPTLEMPKPGEMPEGGARGRRGGMGRRDTTGMFGDIQQRGPRDRQHQQRSAEERERMLKMLVSKVSSQPVTFYKGDNESVMSQDSAKVFASGNNLVFSAFVSYEKLEKVGKKGLISLGISMKEIEMPEGFGNGGMMGPPPGMMGGMMPPPPGMGRGFGGAQSLKEVKTFSEWIVFTIKNTNFTTE